MTDVIARTWIDKSTWGEGPWQSEPDKIQFEAHGLPALIRRGPGGQLCGYVGVGPDHPWHGKGYSECLNEPRCEDVWCEHTAESTVKVHGGLTYAAPCDADEGHGICHVPQPGQPEPAWWFGFDCAHSGDLTPGRYHSPELDALYAEMGDYETYKTVEYVRTEVIDLARQLAEVTS